MGRKIPTLPITAWAVVLIISSLPDILFRELGGTLPGWVYWAKVGVLVVGLTLSLALKGLRPLKLFFGAVLGLYLAQWALGELFTRLNYNAWFANRGAFLTEMFSVQIPRLATSIVMIAFLWMLTGSRKRFFFVFGERSALARPIPGIMTRPTPWQKLGPIFCLCLGGGMIAITWLMGTRPTLSQLAQAAPLLPLIILFAFNNSLGEELNYRAALMTGLIGPLGYVQTLAMTSVYFGVAHFYGVPYGVIGVILSTVMGYLLGKPMLETKGFFWSWMIHVCLDVVVFSFIAVGAVAAGGGR